VARAFFIWEAGESGRGRRNECGVGGLVQYYVVNRCFLNFFLDISERPGTIIYAQGGVVRRWDLPL